MTLEELRNSQKNRLFGHEAYVYAGLVRSAKSNPCIEHGGTGYHDFSAEKVVPLCVNAFFTEKKVKAGKTHIRPYIRYVLEEYLHTFEYLGYIERSPVGDGLYRFTESGEKIFSDL